jgi:methylmalonyl-CoA epimerase
VWRARSCARRFRGQECPRLIWNLFMAFALDHLGIAVKSLNAAKAIYQKLGLTISAEEEIPAEKVRLVMVPLGDTRLELLEALSEDSVIARFISKRGEGLHHISLRVPDLNAAVEKLKLEGVRLVSEQIKIGAGGHRYVFVHPSSAGGVLLELVEPAS